MRFLFGAVNARPFRRIIKNRASTQSVALVRLLREVNDGDDHLYERAESASLPRCRRHRRRVAVSDSEVCAMRASVSSSSSSTTRRRFASVSDVHGRSTSPKSSPRRLSRRRCAQRPVRCRMMFGQPDQPETTPPGVPDSIPNTSVESDWRSFRARLVARYPSAEEEPLEWAHPLPAPELGCVLVAHPLMFARQQTYFNLAVIFVFVHDHTGSAGLILNKPTRYCLGEIDVTKNVATGFEENPLYLGGDVGEDSLNLLHRFGDLDNAIEVVKGVYLNGFEAAQKAVLRGSRNPGDFKWYARYCGWNPGQVRSASHSFSYIRGDVCSWRRNAKVACGFQPRAVRASLSRNRAYCTVLQICGIR